MAFEQLERAKNSRLAAHRPEKKKGRMPGPFPHSILLPVGLADFIALEVTVKIRLRQP